MKTQFVYSVGSESLNNRINTENTENNDSVNCLQQNRNGHEHLALLIHNVVCSENKK